MDPDYKLEVRQQPSYARVAIGKEKDRKPIDPPPIVQLKVSPKKDPMQNFLQNPYLIMSCQLIKADDEKDPQPMTNALLGTIVSSLYSLKDTDNSLGGFFVFGDLSVKCEGHFRLEFTLFELRLAEKECYLLATTRSDTFTVYPQKFFPGMAESTFLTRSFSDQGVRLRLRKDSRSITTRKRNSTVADFARQYPRRDHDSQNHRDHRSRSTLNEAGTPPSSLDRPRSMAAQNAGYFDNSQQFRDYAVAPAGGYQCYGGYEDRPFKRQRMATDVSSNQGYDHHDYASYHQAGPRTVPDMPATSMLPYTTGYAVTSNPAAVGLPMPSPYGTHSAVMPPRIDTQMPPSAGPSSAASTFSPGTRRSPGQSYPYPPQQLYQSPPTALHYQAQAPSTGAANGLGIGLDLDAVEKHMQHNQNNGAPTAL
ncbi:hypothetical protein VTK73DRAFT_5393 [Phialemonium thermophilum]|uniref:Velvet domain-containing protein n=1 Tax=Phialemonium thermophilum TaxID=223376 RepID=A0ABR3XYB3_9PEZI